MRIFVVALAALGAGSTALADYVASVTGRRSDGALANVLFLQPGQSFAAILRLEGEDGDAFDAATFRLEASEPGLAYAAGWFAWGDPFTTAGPDDLSIPGALGFGELTAGTFVDPDAPGAADVYFDNLTDEFGDFFASGDLITLSLTVPISWSPRTLTLGVDPLSFARAGDAVPVATGDLLTVIVIPAPPVILPLIAVFATCMARRRRVDAPSIA